MSPLDNIRRPVAAELAEYSALFDQVLTHEEAFMNQPLSYIRSRKGKMMRPILTLLFAKSCGAVGDPALRSAVTLELLHTASLVHDDVVDESEQRRGQASVNTVYDNKIAVLLGDYLLANSLHQAALTGSNRVVEYISRLGSTLAEGEIFQLAAVDRDEISEDNYYRIIRGKTAALFSTCAALGTISQGALDEYVQNAEKFGEIVGICFQIRDDIFDYYDDPAIGKPRGNDMKEGKLTLPAIHALKATQDAHALALAARVKQGIATPDEIAELIAFSKAHGGIDYAHAQMQRLRAEAIDCLGIIADQDIRAALVEYLDFVIDRTV